jgi:hypothetical protein
MALKDLLHKVHGPEQLSAAIDIFILKREEEDRSDAWHPSSFRGMCPRREIIKLLLGMDDIRTVEPRTKRIWDVGTAIHSWYQNEYLGPMGILWGKWQCASCDSVKWGFMPERECPECKRERWRYKEVPIRAKLSMGMKPIAGHSDGLLNLPMGWADLELKSTNDRIFNQLTLDHKYVQDAIAQGQIYSELILQECVSAPEGIAIPKPTKLLVMYVNKDKSFEKEFLVDLDRKKAKEQLHGPVQYEEAIMKEELPDKWKVCTTIDVHPASTCEVNTACFHTHASWKVFGEKGGVA